MCPGALHKKMIFQVWCDKKSAKGNFLIYMLLNSWYENDKISKQIKFLKLFFASKDL